MTDLPKTLGGAIDRYYRLREDKRNLETQARILSDKLDELEKHIFAQFGRERVEGAKGRLATAFVIPTDVPTVTDWAALHRYIIKYEALDLLHRRVAVAAWRERIETGEHVPGIKAEHQISLGVRGLKT